MTDADSNGPAGLFNDRRRIAFGAAVVAFIAWAYLVITPGAPLPTESNMMGLRFGFIGLAVWGGVEYLRYRRSRRS